MHNYQPSNSFSAMKLTDNIRQLFSKEHRSYYDKVFWLMMIFLVAISILTDFSASAQLAHRHIANGSNHLIPIYSHTAFLLGGLLLAYVVQLLPSWFIRGLAYVLVALSIVFLLLTFVPGFGVEINGARRWLRLGIVFQPSEIAKISLIIVVADLLARMDGKDPDQRRKLFIAALALTIVICGLIMLSNLSTAVMLGGVVFIMMFLARVDWKVLVGMVATAVVLLVIGYSIVKFGYINQHREMNGPLKRSITWVNRIDKKLASDDEPLPTAINDDNRQEVCSYIAVARGSRTPFGVGVGNSKERDFLPLAFADSVFAIYVEETGIIGAVALIFIYLTILFRACTSSNRFGDHAAMLMVMGLGLLITLQAFISMAVVVGIGPVTGQPLPMISRGGTGILLTSLYFGVMMAVSREQNQIKAQTLVIEKESMQDEAELVS